MPVASAVVVSETRQTESERRGSALVELFRQTGANIPPGLNPETSAEVMGVVVSESQAVRVKSIAAAVGSESANVINITFHVVDLDGDRILGSKWAIEVFLSNSKNGGTQASPDAGDRIAVTKGTLLDKFILGSGAEWAAIVITDLNGECAVDFTHVLGTTFFARSYVYGVFPDGSLSVTFTPP